VIVSYLYPETFLRLPMKKFAVILSGCGVYDGSEIHEATLTLLAISKAGASYAIFAPDKPMAHVVNHLTGEVMPESRNVLVESARIARGAISAIELYNPKMFDGLILPGGFGAAKNLSNFAFTESHFEVDRQVAAAIAATRKASKPIAALCIAPVLLASVLRDIECTIGNDPGTISRIEALGARHTETGPDEICIDRENKIVTSPCYMVNTDILKVSKGIENVIKALLMLQ